MSVRTRIAIATLSSLLYSCGGSVQDTGLDCAQSPTWHQDVAPIIGPNCSGCHSEGQIAAYRPLLTYEQSQPWSALIADEVSARTMPPFIADFEGDCPERFPLIHDRRLAKSDIDTLTRWHACGAPLGDASSAAPIESPPSASLLDYTHEIEPENGYSPTRGDLAICWAMPIPESWFETGEDAIWLNALEVLPEDATVTHHIQVQIFPDESIDSQLNQLGYFDCTGIGGLGGIDFAGWLPGTLPVEMPADVAVEVTRSSRITMQIHYHVDNDEPHTDKTRLRLRFGEEPALQPEIYRVGDARNASQGLLPGPNDLGVPVFYIPANTYDHTEEMVYRVPGSPSSEFRAFMLTNHMHYVGTDMRMWVEHQPEFAAPGEPLVECLLCTPRYDFGWQAFFYYAAMSGQAPIMRGGDTIRLRCTYNNNVDNELWMQALEDEGMPRVPVDVLFGVSTLDEMCLGMVGVVPVVGSQ
ncbi:MAG: hypothetical protein GWP91_13545 [Rhodobacterales bacterium]|nr:hypothetical protein [Rhodobacterales bacterium]